MSSSASPLPGDPDFIFNPLSPEYDRDPDPTPAVARGPEPLTIRFRAGARFGKTPASVSA